MRSATFGPTFREAIRPDEKERIHNEPKICRERGLENRRELWRVHSALAKVRKAAPIC
jgi:hypothetical protein